MLQTVRTEKVYEKWSHLPSFQISFLSYVQKSEFLATLCWTQQDNCLLKQFTYMHLKAVITLFQEIVWFIGVWATIHEILAIKITKKVMTLQKFSKFLQLQTLTPPKQ